MPTTARTGTPYPAYSDVPDVPSDMQAAILNLEPYTNLRYTSTSARDADITAPLQGMQCTVAGAPMIYDGTAWRYIVTDASVPAAANVAYVPTFTAGIGAYGTGNVRAGYLYQIGKMVFWSWRVEFGSTGTPAFSAELQWDIPIPPLYQGIGLSHTLGSWTWRSNVSGLKHFAGSVGVFAVGTNTAFLGGAFDGTAHRIRMGATGTPALANSDILAASGSYLAA